MSFVAKKLGMGYAQKAAQQAVPPPADPHYETYTDSQGRSKQRKRAIPQGLSKRDQRILRSVRRRAHYLDKGFNLCGFRVGWTFFLGLIPGLGDVVDFLLGYCLIVRKCKKADLPALVVSKLMTNLIIGTCLGVVPIIGDIMLATWKANSRNAALLEDFLIKRALNTQAGADPAGSRQHEAAVAQTVVDNSHIHSMSGERLGPAPPHSLDDELANERAPLNGGAQGGQKKRKWYGWGGKPSGTD